jgi:hypothetical protein
MPIQFGSVLIPTPADILVRNAVLATLRDPAVARMSFKVGWILILPSDYERVAKAIESGAITVQVDPKVSSHMALYDYDSNSFHIPPGGSSPELLIHEATHAIFDLRSLSTSTGEAEGMAYIAQALFRRIKYGPQPRYIPDWGEGVFSHFGWQMIFDQAASLADILFRTPSITRDQAQILFNSVGMTVTYINQGSYAGYNGVPGA